MANWQLPIETTQYLQVLADLKNRDVDAGTMFINAPVNPPTGGMRFLRAPTLTLQEYDGAAWQNRIVSVASGGTGANNLNDFKASLGLGTMAYQNSNAVNVTGGNIIGLNSLSTAQLTITLAGSPLAIFFHYPTAAANTRRWVMTPTNANTFKLSAQNDDGVTETIAYSFTRSGHVVTSGYTSATIFGIGVNPTVPNNLALQLGTSTGVCCVGGLHLTGNMSLDNGTWRFLGPGYGMMMVANGTNGLLMFYGTANYTGAAGGVATLINIGNWNGTNGDFNVIGNYGTEKAIITKAVGDYSVHMSTTATSTYCGLYFNSHSAGLLVRVLSRTPNRLEYFFPSGYVWYHDSTIFYPVTDGVCSLGLNTNRFLWTCSLWYSAGTGGGYVWDQNAELGIVRGGDGVLYYKNVGYSHQFNIAAAAIGVFNATGFWVHTGNINVFPRALTAPSYGFINEAGTGMTLTSTGATGVLHFVMGNVSNLHIERTFALFGVPIIAGIHFLPKLDNTYYLGWTTLRWAVLHTVNAPVVGSDERDKTAIVKERLGLEFINKIEPIEYKWKKSVIPTKTKHGISAQQLKKVLDEMNVEFDGLAGDEKVGYGLAYTELIAPIIKAIQELDRKVEAYGRSLSSTNGPHS